MRTLLRCGAAVLVATAGFLTGHAAVPIATPESVGFSSAGLKNFEQQMHALVDEQQLAGVTTLVSRRGKVVAFNAHGFQDVETKTPLAKDTIFRIASMTKPIAGVAMMMLFEEGKWALDDPVAKHIPQFKDLKVASANGPVAQAHPMTMRELMSHTAGFDVSGAEAYQKVQLTDRTKPLSAMIEKLAALPLAVQPGTDWRYGPSVDIQGYVVEKLSGQTLDVFLQKRIFDPLKMKDTGFWVDTSKVGRISRRAHLRSRQEDHDGRTFQRSFGQAGFPVWKRWFVVDDRRLLALRPDAGKRWRARGRTVAQARDRRADAQERPG